jgi:hypothetical protein
MEGEIIKLYVDTDDEGNIVSSLAGCDIVPRRPFDFFLNVKVGISPRRSSGIRW